MGFHYLDYIIFFLFLVISLSIGLYHAFRGGKQKTTEEFLMGNRKFSAFPVAISITLSFISAIMVLGQPAEVYTRGTQFTMVVAGQACGSIFSIIFIVPVFFGLGVTSSFEYLELRYDSKCVKLVGSITTLVSMTIQLGIVLYAPAVALEAVTGIPTWSSIILSSLVAIIYTTLGGMKAVIWTDVFQGLCLLAGMCAVVVKGTLVAGGFSQIWERNEATSRIEFFNMNPDPTIRTTFWSAFVSGTFVNLGAFGIGQTTVQRYCALPTLAKARCALVINTFLLTCLLGLATVVGIVIYAYYDLIGCDPIKSKIISSPNQIFPYFVMDVLNYPGIPGLFISVLYGGALSTISSSLNSAAAVTWQDLLMKFFKHLQDSKRALINKFLVVIYGLISIGMAFLAKYLGPHVLQAVNVVVGTFQGPVLGIFIFGMFFKFANAKGAVAGCITGTLVTAWIAVGSLVTNQNGYSLPTSIDRCFANLSNSTFTTLQAENISSFHQSTTLLQLVSESSTLGGYEMWTEDNTKSNDNDPSRKKNGLDHLYSISYLLFPLVGFLVTIIVGISVSLATGGLKQRNIDSNLLSFEIFKKSFFSVQEDILRKNQLPVELITFKEHKEKFPDHSNLSQQVTF